MKLPQLLKGIDYVVLQEVCSLTKMEVKWISCDSRKTKKGDLFFCMEGVRADGHDYMEEAAERGAAVLVVDRMGKHGKMLDFPDGVTILFVKNTREVYARVSAAFFDYPAEDLKIIGITGTKGKTTVAIMIKALLESRKIRTGAIGTLGIFDGEEWISTKNTTPDAFTIHQYFDKIKNKGCEYVVMEVSSQGIKQQRICGLEFEIAVFTNLGEDHIGPGEHGSFAEYRYYKSCLFRQCRKGICNLDDIQSGYMFRRAECEKYGFTCQSQKATMRRMEPQSVMRAERVEFLMEGNAAVTRFEVEGESYILHMPGMFNVYNALAALQVMRCLGESAAGESGREGPSFSQVLSNIQVDGRMERVPNHKNLACYIDYAHNGMSLQTMLLTFRMYQPRRILLVFGCGGNRAKGRRYEMGKVAVRLADVVYLTTDNPREEEPEAIIRDIICGMESETEGRKAQYRVIPERRSAIREAVKTAQEGDIVIIAGKGHERYQEIRGVRYFMDDHELIKESVDAIQCM